MTRLKRIYAAALATGVVVLLNGCGGACAFVMHDEVCEAAAFNAPRLPRVEIGMTMDQVRRVMERPPQRREARVDSETWYFMNDYDAELMTTITFNDGKVTVIGTAPWQEGEQD